MLMTNYSESDLFPTALQILKLHPDGIDTQNLVKQMRIRLKPNGEDVIVLANRNDDRFSQKVRNLKSHKTLEKKNFAIFQENKFFITNDGLAFLDNNCPFCKDLRACFY